MPVVGFAYSSISHVWELRVLYKFVLCHFDCFPYWRWFRSCYRSFQITSNLQVSFIRPTHSQFRLINQVRTKQLPEFVQSSNFWTSHKVTLGFHSPLGGGTINQTFLWAIEKCVVPLCSVEKCINNHFGWREAGKMTSSRDKYMLFGSFADFCAGQIIIIDILI